MSQKKRDQEASHRDVKDRPRHGQQSPASTILQSEGDVDALETWQILTLFLLPHLLAASWSPIQDCDEVFNYWEASHYLNHGYGFQTWEYSPVYAIRSWAYAGLHAVVIAPFTSFASLFGGKLAEFFLLRSVLGVFCAACETRLFEAVSKTISPRTAMFFMIILITSTGMFHAATAYLPSTFAMYTTMLGTADFMEWRTGQHRARGVLWFGIGAVMGWPFAGALVIPFALMEAIDLIATQRILDFVKDMLRGGIQSVVIAVSQALVDASFYGKLLCVPLNIVLYNVFAGSSKGPDIYGTEPWHFYLRNLALNFNIWLPIALAAHPLLLLQRTLSAQPVSKQPFLRSMTFTSGLYLWLLIFTLQPHKEERFMYPVYPLIPLNAAYSLQVVFQSLESVKSKSKLAKASFTIQVVVIAGLVLSSTAFSVLRTTGLVTGYGAPLKVYAPLQTVAVDGDIVCLGKEWYRFPSSYFLPHGVKAKFIKSSFSGLLPGEFPERKAGAWGYSGTKAVPTGMNDENREDMGKYTDISECTFLVDSYLPSVQASDLEPNYIQDTANWQQLTCERFLDVGATSAIGRIFWTPAWAFLPASMKRHWGSYCLLARRSKK